MAERADSFREVAAREIEPHADRFDREEQIPGDWLARFGRTGFFGAMVPRERGGLGLDMVEVGRLHEEIGRASCAVQSILTVQGMVAQSLLRFGTEEQRARWLPRLAAGEELGAFCLSEPGAGSDARAVETAAAPAPDGGFALDGVKKWITAGQVARVFLVIARCEGEHAAFLVERERPGVEVRPISGMLGHRGSLLAEVTLRDCRVPREGLLGKVGAGFSLVASTALDLGRYAVACGCVGLAQACLDASVRHATERRQFGAPLREHELVQRMIARMVVGVKAARLLARNAGALRDAGDPEAVAETCVAKYFASTTAARSAADAVQIHGAIGASAESPVQRYYRDAKVMEIIEGSTEIQEITIARAACGAQP